MDKGDMAVLKEAEMLQKQQRDMHMQQTRQPSPSMQLPTTTLASMKQPQPPTMTSPSTNQQQPPTMTPSMKQPQPPTMTSPSMNQQQPPTVTPSMKQQATTTTTISSPSMEKQLPTMPAPADITPKPRKTVTLRNKSSHKIMNELLWLGCAGEAKNGLFFEPDELKELLKKVEVALLKQPSLVPATSPVMVIGDLHGSYRTLFNIFELYGWPGEMAYLFLGDYVDRGLRSLEVIVLLFVCAMQYPDIFHILRGNHETARVNYFYGFRSELITVYGSEAGHQMWECFNRTMAALPIAGLINGRALCMHGGLSPHLHTLADITNIKRPLRDTHADPLAHDLMWADPSKANCAGDDESVVGGEDGCLSWLFKLFRPAAPHYDTNDKRNTSVFFDQVEVERTVNVLNIDLIIRAHEMQPFGYAFFAGKRLLTIFSRPNYGNSRNYGAVAMIDQNNRLTLHVMMPLEATQNPDYRPVIMKDKSPSTVYGGATSTASK